MARNDFQDSFDDAFRRMLEMPEVANGTGSLRFVRPDKKTIGTIALRSGKIEALEITRHPNYILQRAANTDELSQENKDQLLSKFRNTPDSPLVADYLRQYMMLPDQVITGFVKEHFLGVLDEMMTWTAVKPEWKQGASDRVLTMPFVSPDKLLSLGRRRADYLANMAEECTVEVNQLDELQFKQIADVKSEDPDTLNILRLGSGEYSPEGVYRQIGIVPFNVKRELYELWREEVVDLIYAGQFMLARPKKAEPETVGEDSVTTPTAAGPITAQPQVDTRPETAEDHIAAAAADVEDQDVDIERWLAERSTITSAEASVDETESEATVNESEVEVPAESGEDIDDTESLSISAPDEDPAAVKDEVPEMELQPFVSPFDDDYHAQLLAEGTQVEEPEPEAEPLAGTVEIAATLDAQATPAVPASTNPEAPVAVDATAFLQSINQLKAETQTSWDEVVIRDEEIAKTRALIAEQQEYLDQLEEQRAAWNADFETKRATYEATVALLREHLQ